MRVISGRSRGRRLPAPVPPGVRPTSDRVREAIFDILGSMGGVEGMVVADLYCGSGAMGIEALSRGAASVTFVDHAAHALDAVRANLDAVGLVGGTAAVVRGFLPGWLEAAPRFDLALCDPPYAFDQWSLLLDNLEADMVVLESAGPVDVPSPWRVAKVRRYGGTLVTVVHPTSSALRSGPAPDS